MHLNQTCKINGLINLQTIIPRAALLTTYKSFLRLHLDFIYDRAFNESFQNKLEPV